MQGQGFSRTHWRYAQVLSIPSASDGAAQMGSRGSKEGAPEARSRDVNACRVIGLAKGDGGSQAESRTTEAEMAEPNRPVYCGCLKCSKGPCLQSVFTSYPCGTGVPTLTIYATLRNVRGTLSKLSACRLGCASPAVSSHKEGTHRSSRELVEYMGEPGVVEVCADTKDCEAGAIHGIGCDVQVRADWDHIRVRGRL